MTGKGWNPQEVQWSRSNVHIGYRQTFFHFLNHCTLCIKVPSIIVVHLVIISFCIIVLISVVLFESDFSCTHFHILPSFNLVIFNSWDISCCDFLIFLIWCQESVLQRKCAVLQLSSRRLEPHTTSRVVLILNLFPPHSCTFKNFLKFLTQAQSGGPGDGGCSHLLVFLSSQLVLLWHHVTFH